MKRRNKIFFTLIALLVFLQVKMASAAVNVTPGGAGAPPASGCTDCSWTYSSSGLGVRLSLYKYDEKEHLTFVDSVDLVNEPSAYPSKVNTTKQKYGRYSYTKLGKNIDFAYYTVGAVDINDFGFSTINENDDNWATKFANEVQDYYGETEDETIGAIKSMFGVTATKDELAQYYIVAEPTAFFYSRVGKFYTYATGYEYMEILDDIDVYTGSYAWNLWESQGRVTFLGYMFNGMYNRVDSSKEYEGFTDHRYDYYNFLSPNNTSIVKAVSSVMSKKAEIRSGNAYAKSNFPYGVMIFWIGQNSTIIGGCSGTCGSYTGDALLKCAENYCSTDTDVSNSTEKAQCITDKCGYTYTKLTCGTYTDKTPSKTVCDNKTESSETTCKIKSNGKIKYREVCTVSSTVAYPALPKDIKPGEGFEYKVLFSGNKNCTLTIDAASWKFDYASAWSDSERATLVSDITSFNNMKVDEKEEYKFNSKSATIEIDIEEKKNGKDIGKKESLVPEEKYENGDDEIRLEPGTTSVYSFHSNAKTPVYTVTVHNTESTNSVYYKLPNVCVSSKDNETVYKNTTCGTDKGPYNKYFTNRYSDARTNDTKTTVNHDASGMVNVQNDCEYKVTKKKLSCYITIEPGSVCTKVMVNNVDIKFKLNYIYDGNEPKVYTNIAETGYKTNYLNFNNKTEHVIPKNSVSSSKTVKVYGTVSDTIDYANCYTEIIATPQKCEWVKTEKNGKMTLKIKNIADSGAVYYIKYSSSGKWLKKQSITFDKDSSVTINGKIVTSSGDVYTCDYTNKCSKRCTTECQNDKACAKNFCEQYWHVDVDNYSSYDACYDACTMTSCKKQFDGNKCYNIDEIRNYCKTNYNKEGNNYETVATCINDCSCGINNGPDYYYRTIENDNPFPQREANANWLGFEEYITNDVDDKTPSNSVGDPEYEIVLDGSRMNKIVEHSEEYNSEAGNDAYNDYIWKDDKPLQGSPYKSKFIHNDDVNEGGFKSYFTYIEGIKTS